MLTDFSGVERFLYQVFFISSYPGQQRSLHEDWGFEFHMAFSDKFCICCGRSFILVWAYYSKDIISIPHAH
jgi:hypothetical protein